MSETVFKSIRPFLGAKNFDVSRQFYSALGFTESIISGELSLFSSGEFGFYLQKAYVKDWVDNTMVFMEVEDVYAFWDKLVALDLPSRFEGVRIVPVRELPWGRECFVHDPSGILWHFGSFS